MSRTFLTTGAAKVLAPREANVGDRLPYLGHLDEVTLQTRDGLLVQTLHLAGFPSETAPDDELNYRKAIRETVLRGAASSRLAIYHHVVRRRVTPAFPDPPEEPFCAGLDAGWRDRLAGRRLYVNDIFLTLVRRPLQGGAGFLERLVRQPGAKAADLERELRALNAARDAFAAALAPYGPRTLALYDGPGGAQRSEPAEFLSLI
ncbi:MAG: VirB4 family type IV secretion/conjugal transfer ATPase, partial [Phenylobacterium sp.]